MTMRPARPTSWIRIGTGLLGSFVASASWVALIASAIVFYQRLEGAGRYRWYDAERIAFATAFAAAGSVTAIAALAMFGSSRRALGSMVFLVALLPLPAYQIGRTIDPRTLRFLTMARLLEIVQPSLFFGLATGGIAAAGVVALGVATKRALSWRVALIAGASLCVLVAWVLPPLLLRYWHTVQDAIVGVMPIRANVLTDMMAGAVVGAIWGAVTGAVTSRWFRPASTALVPTDQDLHARS